ncbi:MAG TPA: TSUP family transporter, partial [Burkholderiales bacterium]|nr:TSUP family transporter [Burkholderiales bacterium]
MNELIYIVAGFGVGVLLGLTGIGGGALMTPLLVLLFGVTPKTAVGTDLLFAAVTKVVGVGIHGVRGTVDWRVVYRLSLGSLPAAAGTTAFVALLGREARHLDAFVLDAVGIMLMLTAAGLLLKPRLHAL